MLSLLIGVAVIAWFGRQFYSPHAERWQARGRALAPIGRHIRGDVQAVGRMVAHPVRARRDLRDVDLDAELRQLAG